MGYYKDLKITIKEIAKKHSVSDSVLVGIHGTNEERKNTIETLSKSIPDIKQQITQRMSDKGYPNRTRTYSFDDHIPRRNHHYPGVFDAIGKGEKDRDWIIRARGHRYLRDHGSFYNPAHKLPDHY